MAKRNMFLMTNGNNDGKMLTTNCSNNKNDVMILVDLKLPNLFFCFRSAAVVESNGGSFHSSGSSSAYQSMPGNSASMLAARNSARISQQHFGTVSNCHSNNHSGRSTSVSTTNTRYISRTTYTVFLLPSALSGGS